MFGRFYKFIAKLLMVALLLAPLELTVAHAGTASCDMEAGSHSMHMMVDVDMEMDVDMADHDQCHQKGPCKHCVYCSPALSQSAAVVVDIPSVTPSHASFTGESIELPVEHRPPRFL